VLIITNLTKQKTPKIPWQKIANDILGKKYDLSVVLAGNKLMRKLNNRYRKKDRSATVLSFPLSKKEAPRLRSGQGEIFINLSQKKHPLLYLYIHGLLHLKSFKHSAKMEIIENKLMKKFNKYEGGNHNRP